MESGMGRKRLRVRGGDERVHQAAEGRAAGDSAAGDNERATENREGCWREKKGEGMRLATASRRNEQRHGEIRKQRCVQSAERQRSESRQRHGQALDVQLQEITPAVEPAAVRPSPFPVHGAARLLANHTAV